MSRRKSRYKRRMQKREEKKALRTAKPLDELFNFHDVYKYGKECCKGVRWKTSVQTFERHLFSGTAKRCKAVKNGIYRWKNYNHFQLNERGKTREIDAPHITDRQIQKVLTKEVLLPCYMPYMIYNNGASLKNKGLLFSQKLLERDLHAHYRKYGLNGWVIVTDCKGFFPNADHKIIKNTHLRLIDKPEVRMILDSVVDSSPTAVGVPLGVEPSQVEMIGYPYKLDAYMKCQLKLGYSGHYMDDYYMLIPPDRNPYEIVEMFIDKAMKCGILINKNKTHIVRFGKPFRYCKTNYIMTQNGRLIRHGSRKTAYRAIRKIKRLKPKIDNSDITYMDLWATVQSLFNYFKRKNDNGRVTNFIKIFKDIYGFDCRNVKEFKRMDACSYIAHAKYRGKTIDGNEILIPRGKRLYRDKNILYYDRKPVCIYRSEVARKHFSKNHDGKGLTRGDLTRKIAYSDNRVNVNGWMQRFNENQVDVLTSDRWKKFINPEHDVIIFTDAFFEADIFELQELNEELEGCKNV